MEWEWEVGDRLFFKTFFLFKMCFLEQNYCFFGLACCSLLRFLRLLDYTFRVCIVLVLLLVSCFVWLCA